MSGQREIKLRENKTYMVKVDKQLEETHRQIEVDKLELT